MVEDGLLLEIAGVSTALVLGVTILEADVAAGPLLVDSATLEAM